MGLVLLLVALTGWGWGPGEQGQWSVVSKRVKLPSIFTPEGLGLRCHIPQHALNSDIHVLQDGQDIKL